MKNNIVLILMYLIFSLSAFAATETKTLSMFCFDQYYIKLPPNEPEQGVWLTGIGTQRIVVLTKDPNYPNANEPRTIWVGQYDEKINGGDVHLDLQALELNGKVGYRNTISVNIDGITAESEGGSYVRAALKTNDKSAGAICTEMKLE